MENLYLGNVQEVQQQIVKENPLPEHFEDEGVQAAYEHGIHHALIHCIVMDKPNDIIRLKAELSDAKSRMSYYSKNTAGRDELKNDIAALKRDLEELED